MSQAELIKEAHEIFALFNKENSDNHSVEGQDYAEMLRAVGLTPTLQEENQKHNVTKDEFIERVKRSTQTGQSAAYGELLAALRMFDIEQTGVVNTATMRNILVNLGDRLDANEVETVVAKMKSLGHSSGDGEVTVPLETFAEMILTER